MLFNSPIYIFLFLPLVFFVYFTLNQWKFIIIGKVWLVSASLFFYGYWNPSYLLLIIASMLFNYAIGRILHRTKTAEESKNRRFSRLSVLIIGLLFNLSLLGYYKYSDFFIANINTFFDSKLALLNLALPLAISFFTFQQIAYLIDSFRKDTQEYDFLNYCLFVSFFPQLIAGPIVHHREMMPQFARTRNKLINWRNITLGSTIFSIGLFKKVIVADSFAIWANAGFGTGNILQFFDAWGTSLSYTFQLYYDFSGYSDMAIGAALLFNIRLPINFNSPYKALNIQDFWQRWHMTLSRWLKDYVYIPLGGNRNGEVRTYINLMATFLIGGLWHGAGWTFVAWGCMHGIALSVHRLWQKTSMRMSTFSGWFFTFLFVNTSWVFFRAESFDDAWRVLKGMAGLNGFALSKPFINIINYLLPLSWPVIPASSITLLLPITALGYIVLFALVAFLAPNSLQLSNFSPYHGRITLKTSPMHAILLATIFFASIMTFFGDVTPSEFLYFNF